MTDPRPVAAARPAGPERAGLAADDTRTASPQLRRTYALLLLLVVPLFLRLSAVQHGLPRSYVPDTHMVRNALGMARDKDPVPPMGQYSTYPYLVPYMLLPVYAAQYAVGRVDASWAGAGEYGNRVKEHPEIAWLPARVLVALLGALTPVVVFRTARVAGLRLGAWAAAWLVATSLLHVHFSVQERPWVPMLFFGALSAWPAELYRRERRARFLALSGAAVGLAAGCHQAGLALAIVPFTAWLLAARGWAGVHLLQRARDGVACAASFAALFLVGNAYYLFTELDPHVAQRAGDLQGQFAVGGQAARFGFSLGSLRHLTTSLFGYDPSVCLLALLGIGPALASWNTRAAAVAGLVFAAVFLPYPNDHVRYVLPLIVLLALPAGLGVERLVQSRWGAWIASPLLLLPLVQALRFDWVVTRDDTRASAELLLAGLPDGARVGIDHYGPQVDLDRGSLERLAELRDLRTRERHRLELLTAGAPTPAGVDAVPLEDLFEGHADRGGYRVREAARRHGAEPRDVLASLGVTHLLLVDRRPGDGRSPPLKALAERGTTQHVLDPSRGDDAAREALLPTEMDFPLVSLWTVERPGPWMALYRLPAAEAPADAPDESGADDARGR